jgi:hypothetical protein
MNRIVAAACALAFAAPASAAVLQVTGGGQLTGAAGVTVGGATYDVSFVDGTCTALFGGCDDAAADFTFTTLADAQTAAQALLDQVLIDGGAGQFDTDFAATLGCAANNALACAILIPYATSVGSVSAAQALNTPTTDTNNVIVTTSASFNTADAPQYVWARFAAATVAVPEPSAWAMMLLGFAGIGLATRRRRAARLQ